jgi:hypothetical protein
VRFRYDAPVADIHGRTKLNTSRRANRYSVGHSFFATYAVRESQPLSGG